MKDIICVVPYEPPSVEIYSKWISVKDDLPEKYKPVLVCRISENGKKSVDTGYRTDKRWQVYGTVLKTVTHWMPLPEPPEDAV